MAIIKFLKPRKSNIRSLINYISNPKKTQNYLLVSGKDCSFTTCYEEMQTVKNIFNKKNGYTAFHFTQSFSPDDNLSYEKAHEISLQLAEYFKGYQVVIATHTDKKHIHSHFAINSVSFENGKKLHIGKKERQEIKMLSNKLCEENGLKTINLEIKSRVKDISQNELAVAQKGQSWKFKLMNDIDYCMSISNTKEEYIKNMNKLNYQVVWTDSRKYITYTTPEGHKCRDRSLHDEKYLKENMKIELTKKLDEQNSLSNNEFYKTHKNYNSKSLKNNLSHTNYSQYKCNTNLENLRFLAYILNCEVIRKNPRNINSYSGDLSKQARKEWYLKHLNSDGFNWEEDFEL